MIQFGTFEHIVYDKRENTYIFLDSMSMSSEEYEKMSDEIEFDEQERYYYLPSKYNFHDSEIVEEYINIVNDVKIQNELEYVFYGKGKFGRFKDVLRRYDMLDSYYKFREDYLKELAIDWCEENKLEYCES